MPGVYSKPTPSLYPIWHNIKSLPRVTFSETPVINPTISHGFYNVTATHYIGIYLRQSRVWYFLLPLTVVKWRRLVDPTSNLYVTVLGRISRSPRPRHEPRNNSFSVLSITNSRIVTKFTCLSDPCFCHMLSVMHVCVCSQSSHDVSSHWQSPPRSDLFPGLPLYAKNWFKTCDNVKINFLVSFKKL
jgi:hypothetical protein